MNNSDLANSLREAVRESGRTPYRIAKDAGFHQSTLTRFLQGEGITLANLQALTNALELDVLLVPSRRTDCVSPAQS